MRVAYPRLGRTVAERELLQLQDAHVSGGIAAVEALVRFDHERKQPVATGRIATPGEIAAVRSRVMEAVSNWVGHGPLSAPEQRAGFDNDLGVALHRHLQVVPSDAGHEETWSFLSILVFPDLAAIRFQDLPEARLIGTPRNVLRRVWQRQEVLGELLQEGDSPLGEDELVGLFERTALIRNRSLARHVVDAVYAYEGPRRSSWARRLYKLVTFQTGARMLDALSEDELATLVAELAVQAKDLSDDPHSGD